MSYPKVLIVEDEFIVAFDLKQALTALNFDVIAVVSSGEEALSSLEQCIPDLILMDIKLNGSMDGIETAAKINDIHDIPVVYMSANADLDSTKQVMQTRPHAFIPKPVVTDTLESVLKSALHKR